MNKKKIEKKPQIWTNEKYVTPFFKVYMKLIVSNYNKWLKKN